VHHLVERVDVPGTEGGPRTAWVMATNVYVKTPQGWRWWRTTPARAGRSAPEPEPRPAVVLH
jgi:hypothetical protein